VGARDLQFRFFLPADPATPGSVDDVFAFDMNGSWRWRNEFVYKDSADDSQAEQVRAVWELIGNAQLSPDGTFGEGWEQLRAAFAVFHQRGGSFPTKVEIVRDPGGAGETVELTLGADDWEDFRVDELSGGEPFELAPDATHRTAFPVTIRVSAIQRFEETRNATATGIVQFEQTVTETFEAGLRLLEWETTVTTRKGTDAVAKAKTFGLIPIEPLGSRYTYLTNGADGVNVTILDSDKRDDDGEPTHEPARVPTKVRVVCRVKEWPLEVGVTEPGTGPDTIALTRETKVTDEEQVRTVIAEAVGPGAETWVRRQRPAGDLEETIREGEHERSFRAEWTIREKSPKAELVMVLEGELAPGDESPEWEEVAGGLEPLPFWTPLTKWELTLSVELSRRGGTGAPGEMRFPPRLEAPWILNPRRSRERDPFEGEAAKDPERVLWKRTATLVYESPTAPREHPVQWIRKNLSRGVVSYILEA
jgi:hypothetical protein